MSTQNLHSHLQLVEQDRGETPAIAFFDLDRTLIAGYSIVAIARERIRHGLSRGDIRDSAAILRDLLGQQRTMEQGLKGTAYNRLVRTLSKSLKGISEETFTELGKQAYHNTIARSLYSEAIALIETHRRAGHRLVIVSAATRYQVEPIAEVLGVDEICCTGLEVEDGLFTGNTLAPLCYGEGKAMAARRLCKRLGASLNASWFYSDSIDDLPLLRRVGRPVAVNATEKLADYAAAHNWPQLQFETRGLPSLETVFRTLLTMQTVAVTTAWCALGERLGMGMLTSPNLITQVVGEIGSGFAGIDIEVEGSENLTHNRPAVFIFNHQSTLDPMVLAHLLKRDVVALCEKKLAENPLLGPLLREANSIFVDEETDQVTVLKRGLDVLDSGRSVVISPEGTRSTLGEIQPFKHGAFYLAKKAGVPVIPIVLHNVKDALPKGGFLIRATTVRVTVLPPMDPQKMGGVRQTCERMEQDYARVLGNSEVAALPSTLRRALAS
jgi:putative phosphoserine phosphatase/1-acylglycerol-3-phosphate O-acyltransferase